MEELTNISFVVSTQLKRVLIKRQAERRRKKNEAETIR